jgi:WD40 repeat protein
MSFNIKKSNIYQAILLLIFSLSLSFSHAEGIITTPIRTLTGHTIDYVRSVAYSPDGQQALSGSDAGTMKLWNVNTGELLRTFTGHTSHVYSVAYSPDGQRALSGSSDDTMKLWNVNTGEIFHTFTGHTDGVSSVAYSPDGQRALSGGGDKTLKLWNVNTGEVLRTFTGHTSYVTSVAYSPDGQRALSGSWDETLKLWNVNTGEELRTFTGHTGEVKSVAYSPDGQRALSGAGSDADYRDKTMKLWNVNTGEVLRTFKGHTSDVMSVAYSPDGQGVLSGSRDSTLKLRKAISIPTYAKNKKSQPIQTVTESPTPTDTTPPRIILTSRGPESTLVSDTQNYTLEGQALDESGISEITVNKKSLSFDSSGNFSVNTELVIGDNVFSITATDKHDNTAQKTFSIARNEDSGDGKYYALVIGINQYADFQDLAIAVNDAQSVAEVLQNRYGFIVETLLDNEATREGILRALNRFNRKTKKNDSFLVYYAGHGYYDESVKKAYWWPADAEKGDTTLWLIADDITSNIRRNTAKNILIVSDSCYSGTLMREDRVNLNISSEDRLNYLEKMRAKPSRVILASGGNEPVSDVGGQGHSIFTQAFLDGLNTMEDSRFTAQELFIKHIKESVAGKSNQTPEYNIIRDSGHDGGDFVFQKK